MSAGSVAGYPDAHLLKLVAGSIDGTRDLALRALLDRHGPMVWGVCRQLLEQSHDADDAFQATFLVLIRKAASLRVNGSLGPWLYQVASRVARQARSRRREEPSSGFLEQLSIVDESDGPRGATPEQLAVLHGEVNRLPARYRLPIVLCHLEGKSHEEAARALRWPVGTVSGRLSRGRSLLRARLERRGWKTPDDLIGATLPAGCWSRVPPPLLEHGLRAAVRLASGGAATGASTLFMKGVLRSMMWNQMKATAIMLAAVACLTGTAGLLVQASLASSDAARTERPTTSAGNASGQVANDRSPAPAQAAEELGLADPQAGGQRARSTRKPATDASGEITVENASPVVVKTIRQSGATDVDPALSEIRVTFSKDMIDKSWSWTTLSKETFPEAAGAVHFLEVHRTCIMPVKLKPGRTYATWINSSRFTNFMDRDRHSAVPYLLVFRTRP